MDEQELISKVMSGDKQAVKDFYFFYKPKIWNFIKNKAQSQEDAQEIMQDTFLSAIDSLPLFSGKSKVSTWLCSIAYHEISDYYRKKRIKALVLSQAPILEQFLVTDFDINEDFDKKELQLEIENTLSKLLPRYQHVLRQKYLQGLSVLEIASSLGESLKATETALYRARIAFATAWTATEFYEKRI